MMNMTEARSKISMFSLNRDLKGLVAFREDLIKEQKIMDKWFDKYLDMFDRKMDPKEPATPIWKMYNKKYDEYTELDLVIKTANAYVGKLQTV